MHNPSLWNPKSSDVKELHEIDNRIESLQIELNRASNALEKKLPKFVQKSIKSEINFLNKQIEKLEQEIQKIIERNAELKQKADNPKLAQQRDGSTRYLLADLPIREDER